MLAPVLFVLLVGGVLALNLWDWKRRGLLTKAEREAEEAQAEEDRYW